MAGIEIEKDLNDTEALTNVIAGGGSANVAAMKNKVQVRHPITPKLIINECA